MRTKAARRLLAALTLLLTCIPVLAQDKQQAAPKALTATEIIEREQQAFYYPGTDMKATVTMDLITDTGSKRTRVLTMLRKNVAGSNDQKYFLYFHQPGDVRRTAFLVWKYPNKEDDRWVFIPAVNMVRRVAASDSRSSFVGSDFTYEDVSGRDLDADDHSLVREEHLGGADCYVVQSVPKSPMDYTRKLSWIDKKTFLPRKEEYYDVQTQLARLFSADEIRDVTVESGGAKKVYPTATKRTMKNVKSGHRTEVTYESVAYDMGLEDDVFTERSLQNPPQKWIK